MYRLSNYYIIYRNESQKMYENYLSKKLKEESNELEQLEIKVNNYYEDNKNNIKDNKNIINSVNTLNVSNDLLNEYLKKIHKFIQKEYREFKSIKNKELMIYYLSLKSFFSQKGLIISKKFNIKEEIDYFNKISEDNSKNIKENIQNKILEMNEIITKKEVEENKLFGYFNYENLTSSKIFKTLTTIFALTLGALAIYNIKKNYKSYCKS